MSIPFSQTGDAASNPAPGFADHPGHRIDLVQAPESRRAIFRGEIIASSGAALTLREADYPPVVYFPRGDVNMALLERTDHSTYCPFKGEAGYWTIIGGGAADNTGGENVAWSYENPYDEMAALKGHIAFYADRVTIGP